MHSDETLGTRFLLYPQPPMVAGYNKPETIWLSPSPHEIGPGPSDDRIYTLIPAYQKQPYRPNQWPPFTGQILPPVTAGPDGHFDHLTPGTAEFLAAHAYAGVRRMLDLWESYLGQQLPWHFGFYQKRLEIITDLEWDNAHAGFGYIEFGRDLEYDHWSGHYALNFDVIAHEMGHLILLSQIGAPATPEPTLDFRAWHESTSDLIALLSMLNFDTVLDRLLRHGKGNLLTLNELNRLAEKSGERQIRIASNLRRLDETTNEPHDRSTPMTGAVFDTLIDIYHDSIIQQGLVDLPRSYDAFTLENLSAQDFALIEQQFAHAYEHNHFRFKQALTEARDLIATALVQSWRFLSPPEVNFAHCGELMVDSLATIGGPAPASRMAENLIWRHIWRRNHQPRLSGLFSNLAHDNFLHP